MSGPHVAFVGTGAIGLPMARRVAAGGYRITAVDPFAEARARVEADGIAAVASVADLTERPDVVIVMVATGDQLTGLVDATLAAGAAGAGQTWIVMSTVGPESVVAAAKRIEATGAQVLDVPVTGGVARATTGELTLFAAGAADVLAAVSPVLETLGTVRHIGTTIGDGQAVKVVNQHLCSVHIVAAAEALNLADRLGLDPAQVLDLVGSGAGGSWMLGDRGPRMLGPTDVTVTSTIGIFVKDSGLVADAAAEAGVDVPLLQLAQQRYARAVDLGLERRDDSRVIETYQADAAATLTSARSTR